MTQSARRTETARSTCRAHSCSLRVSVVLIAHVDVVHAVIHSSRSHFCSDFL